MAQTTQTKPTVYIETTVISYLTSQPSRDIIVLAHQELTRAWWEKALPGFEAYVSPVVLREIAQGDPAAAAQRMRAVEHLPVLAYSPEAERLSDEYVKALGIPPHAKADADHLALASWHGMDFVATWNCAHLASGAVKRHLRTLNGAHGIWTPEVCTPEELMDLIGG